MNSQIYFAESNAIHPKFPRMSDIVLWDNPKEAEWFYVKIGETTNAKNRDKSFDFVRITEIYELETKNPQEDKIQRLFIESGLRLKIMKHFGDRVKPFRTDYFECQDYETILEIKNNFASWVKELLQA